MWMKWDDPEVNELVTGLRDEGGKMLSKQRLDELEFCLVRSSDDLDALGEGELLEVRDGELHGWTRDDLIIVANWRRPNEQTEATSVEEEEAKGDYPILLARTAHYS